MYDTISKASNPEKKIKIYVTAAQPLLSTLVGEKSMEN